MASPGARAPLDKEAEEARLAPGARDSPRADEPARRNLGRAWEPRPCVGHARFAVAKQTLARTGPALSLLVRSEHATPSSATYAQRKSSRAKGARAAAAEPEFASGDSRLPLVDEAVAQPGPKAGSSIGRGTTLVMPQRMGESLGRRRPNRSDSVSLSHRCPYNHFSRI